MSGLWAIGFRFSQPVKGLLKATLKIDQKADGSCEVKCKRGPREDEGSPPIYWRLSHQSSSSHTLPQLILLQGNSRPNPTFNFLSLPAPNGALYLCRVCSFCSAVKSAVCAVSTLIGIVPYHLPPPSLLACCPSHPVTCCRVIRLYLPTTNN